MRKTSTNPGAVQTPAPVHVIEPTGVYFPEDVRLLLRLRASTIRREVRAGRLRVARRAGRYYLLGAWLLEWIQGGELGKRSARPVKEDKADE